MTFDLWELVAWCFVSGSVSFCAGAMVERRVQGRRDEVAGEWEPRICANRAGGITCVHLAVPGEVFCRQHSVNPVTRNSV